ncbi:D-2-hydroxyacid dehydrogenase [Blastopirellula marina]|uniref:Phosphoglycerate dehydrogenase SerA2-putative NAD-dependent2-hydroxyacid dehydrogenase n=1 Tax=Blastopirellula marina DSM 3645 TaxID=314230 RepID=A4A0V5_9BACT|nr:D-2-hydroxyacid dehydrogenase [Blastopirellula marina]EAQ77612.1 phosphoglycerate dehydrogenase SerA2-putative NAD-dependent2-hydroxyacid dehydrogenase [Blastopirellula marina DSM 3645]
MNIVLCYQTVPAHLEQIRAVAGDWNVIDAGQEGIAAALPQADIYCGHAKVPVPWKETVAAGRLKWIQSSAAGMDHCLVPEVISSEISVTSASGLFANQVAEQTMALLLGVIRSLPTFFRAQLKKEYIRRPTGDLHGKTVGIVGLGGNGRRLAEILAPFQIRIIATDYCPYDKPPCVDELWPADRLHDLLSQSDVVILALPLNDETRGLFDTDQFAAMKTGAIFINVARGQVVRESALIHALTSQHLSAAGVDVAEVEPLPPESPLWDFDNVIITPHVGAQGRTRNDDVTDLFCENLRRFRTNQSLINVVDKRLGFPLRNAPA